ncbi:MAG: FliA/WhiG family RNA polymerase sigma factor [Lachnospiraceae bacterium]|nr:FliA/WhiG family RNA polymerase sigma factor [Lachnospiraceae bacterium]
MDENGRARLWSDYSRTGSQELRDQLIIEYSPLVKVVAGRLSMYLGYNVEYEDLVGFGIFGLIDAIDKFDTRKNIKFETYASLRIRGEILDQIRKNDWIPRTIRQKQKQLDAVMKKIEEQEGREATDEEIAEALGISLEELTDWQSQMNVTNVVSLNEFMDAGMEVSDSHGFGKRFDSPEENLDKEELKRMLVESLESLTEKEKSVVVFYYYEELTLKEIANIMDVTESRVSQLHTKALQKMRRLMGDYVGLLGNLS